MSMNPLTKKEQKALLRIAMRNFYRMKERGTFEARYRDLGGSNDRGLPSGQEERHQGMRKANNRDSPSGLFSVEVYTRFIRKSLAIICV